MCSKFIKKSSARCVVHCLIETIKQCTRHTHTKAKCVRVSNVGSWDWKSQLERKRDNSTIRFNSILFSFSLSLKSLKRNQKERSKAKMQHSLSFHKSSRAFTTFSSTKTKEFDFLPPRVQVFPPFVHVRSTTTTTTKASAFAANFFFSIWLHIDKERRRRRRRQKRRRRMRDFALIQIQFNSIKLRRRKNSWHWY